MHGQEGMGLSELLQPAAIGPKHWKPGQCSTPAGSANGTFAQVVDENMLAELHLVCLWFFFCGRHKRNGKTFERDTMAPTAPSAAKAVGGPWLQCTRKQFTNRYGFGAERKALRPQVTTHFGLCFIVPTGFLDVLGVPFFDP